MNGHPLLSRRLGVDTSTHPVIYMPAGSRIHVSHPGPVTSESRLRAKLRGDRPRRADMGLVIDDLELAQRVTRDEHEAC